MIHDPCMIPQQRSDKRKSDDWFLVRMGCFNGDADDGAGTSGGVDFDDTVRLSGDTRPAYESQVDKAARAKGGDNYGPDTLSDERSFNLAQTRVAEYRAGLPEGTYVRGSDGKAVMSKSGPVLSGRAVEKAAQEQGTTSSDIFNRARSSYFSNVTGARGPSTGSAPSETSEFLPDIFPGAMTMEGVENIDSLTPQDLEDFKTLSNARAQGIPLGASTEGSILARAEALGLSSDIFNPDLAEEFDPPGGGAQLTGIPGVTVAGSPAQKQIQAARGPTAMTMEGNIPLDLQGAIALNVGPVDSVPEQSTVQQELLDPATFAFSDAMTMRGQDTREDVYNVASTPFTGLGSLTPDVPARTPEPDPVGQSIDRAISDFARTPMYGQTRETTPEGIVTDDFYLGSRDLVSKTPAFGASYSPAEQLRMQEGARTLPLLDIPDIEVAGADIPLSLVGSAVSDLVKPASAAYRALERGGTPLPDEQGRIAAVELDGIVYEVDFDPFGEKPPAVKEALERQRRLQEQQNQGRGSDDPIIPPLIPEDPLAKEPEPVVGENIITGPNYQPREPVQFAYTGLPTLAPISLQPTFQAQQQFTPTFGLGALRRS